MQSLKTLGARTALLPALLCAAVLAACGGTTAGSNHSSDGVAVDGELNVGVRAGAIGNAALEAAIAAQGSILTADEKGSFYRVAVKPGVSMDQAAAALQQQPDVVYVEPNYLAWGYAAPTDPLYVTSLYSQKVQTELAAGWDAMGLVTPANAVVLAVLDTGVLASHEELSGKVDVADWKDYVSLANTTVVDDNGHGTQLAAIAAGAAGNSAGIAGVASWDGSADPGLVTILPVKVADASNVSNHAAIANGMSWAVAHGANVILLSLGSATPSWTLQKAVQDAYAAGVLVVAAAGNDGVQSARYPAGYQGTNQAVLSVSSATAADALDAAHKANFGSWVNVLAPGADLSSATSTGDADYVLSLSGSSYAAAHVAGMAALLWTAYVPSTAHGAGFLTVDEVRNAILAGVDSYDRAASSSIALSGGRVNLEKAFAAATNIQSHGATPALPGSVVFNSTFARGGAAVVGTVVLTDPAPVSTSIALHSSSTYLTVPSAVTVLRGSRSATFAVSTSPVAARTTVTVTATGGGVTASGTIDLTTPGVSRIALSPTTAVGGANVSGTVTLAGVAPVGGVAVTLSSSLPDATFATTVVTVAANQMTAPFTVRTAAVTAQRRPRITATANSTSAYADLVLNPALAGISFSPTSVKGGATSTLRVSLNGAMAADLPVTVAITDASSALTPESVVTTITVPRGQTSKSVTVTTVPVVGQATVSATASYGGVTTSAAVLTVNVPAISSLTASTPSLVWWDASHVTTGAATITLDAAAASTTTVYLTSSDSILAVPASVTVPAGARTTAFSVTPAAAVAQVSVTVSASLTPNMAVKKSATFQLKPALQNMTLSSVQVVGGVNVTGTVTLSAAAPTGNFAVALSSDNGARASVDPSVTVTAGQTTRTFVVTTVADPAPATVNVSASVNGVTKTVALKLTAPAISAVTFSPTSAFVGDSVTGTVTLAAAALGNTQVTLAANDTTAVPGLAPIYIGTGATTGTFSFTAGTVTAQKIVTVTAGLNGVSRTGNVTIKPSTVSITLGASTPGGTPIQGTVTLPANAPVGGTAVTLASSDPSAVVSTASVTVPAGSRTATFWVNTLGVNADTIASISAATGGFTARRALSVLKASSFTLSPLADITAAGTVTFTVALNARAGAAGVPLSFVHTVGTGAAVLTPPAGAEVPAQATSVTFTLAVASGDAGSLQVTGTGVTGDFTVNYAVP